MARVVEIVQYGSATRGGRRLKVEVGRSGQQGAQGPAGPAGATGAAGAAATVTVGTTTTGAAGSSASVTNTGTSSAAVLAFTIPRGDTGATGPQGPAGATGATGATGAQGPAGQGVPVGGTTGQVLAKKSATDYDTEWVAQTGGGGSGDVVGPASSVDGRVALFDGTTGKLLKQSTAAPVLEGDARLTDARTPTAHKTSHATGGSDALAPSDIGAVPTTRTINGLDLSANRTLTAADVGAAATSHVHSGADITSGTVGTARLGTGTANSTTFLRGDGTWSAAGSTNASDLTSGTLAMDRLNAETRAAARITARSLFI